MVNIQLLEQVMQHILDHPEQHLQSDWGLDTDCGTVACFAGWTAQLAGAHGLGAVVTYEGQKRFVDVLAADLLDLDYDVACAQLFGASLSLEELELNVKDIINEAGSP